MSDTVLYVEDDESLARTFVRLFTAWGWTARCSRTVADAHRALSGDIDAVITELRLPDGSGLDVVATARGRAVPIPTLLMTGFSEPEVVNGAQFFGAEFACKPLGTENVRRFLERVRGSREPGLTDLVASLGDRHRLTAAERRVVAAAVECIAHDVIAATLGVSANTIKTHVKSILAKAGAESLELVVASLRARAMRQ